MKIKSDEVLYHVVERVLRETEQPLTCTDLMVNPDVRKAALKRFGSDVQLATNKLSDMLGFMWRRGILEKYPAPPSRSMARFAYKLAKPESVETSEPLPPPVPLAAKQQFTISEQNGNVIIDFPAFRITVAPK